MIASLKGQLAALAFSHVVKEAQELLNSGHSLWEKARLVRRVRDETTSLPYIVVGDKPDFARRLYTLYELSQGEFRV